MMESIRLKTLHDGSLKDVQLKTMFEGDLADVTLKSQGVQRVPLWTPVTTSLTLNGVAHEGQAYEVPELHRVIHTVELDGLTPDTVYDFAIPDDATTVYVTSKDDLSTNMVVHWQTHIPVAPNGYTPNPSNTYKFKTLPATLDNKSLTMISGGDIYQSDTQLEKMKDIFRVIANRKPDLFVIAGDIAYANNVWSNRGRWHTFWDEWFKSIDRNEPITPIIAGIGNHEIGNGFEHTNHRGDRFSFEEKKIGHNTWFAAQFAFPQNGAYGVVDAGDYLSIIMLDSEHASTYNTQYAEQTVWLGNTLNARKNVKHVIPFTHIPSFPATRTYSSTVSGRMRDNWLPIYESHGGVKVVFEHHDHVYKRTVPIKIVDGEPAEHPDGIRFLGDGAMGVAIRDGWNYHTTWYLEESIVSTFVESSEPHPLDGEKGYDTTIDEAWHMYETIFENDKRTINTLRLLGDGSGSIYHSIEQEVTHV